METAFQPSMPSAAFFYYSSPESQQDSRQTSQFTPRQYQQQYQYQRQMAMQMGMVKQQMPPQYIYCPPHSQNMAAPMYTPQMLTPVASPYGVAGRQSYFVEQHSSPATYGLEQEIGPTTPPLSVSGSATSSPPNTFSMLPTPVNAQYLDHLDHKYENGVFPETHASQAWDMQSPPLSPGESRTARYQ